MVIVDQNYTILVTRNPTTIVSQLQWPIPLPHLPNQWSPAVGVPIQSAAGPRYHAPPLTPQQGYCIPTFAPVVPQPGPTVPTQAPFVPQQGPSTPSPPVHQQGHSSPAQLSPQQGPPTSPTPNVPPAPVITLPLKGKSPTSALPQSLAEKENRIKSWIKQSAEVKKEKNYREIFESESEDELQ